MTATKFPLNYLGEGTPTPPPPPPPEHKRNSARGLWGLAKVTLFDCLLAFYGGEKSVTMPNPHRPLISWVSFMFWGVVPSPEQFRMPVSLNLPWPQYYCENFSLISVGYTRFYLLNEGENSVEYTLFCLLNEGGNSVGYTRFCLLNEGENSVEYTLFCLLNEGGKQCGVHSFLPS